MARRRRRDSFFHGTNASFDVLRPAASVGRENYDYDLMEGVSPVPTRGWKPPVTSRTNRRNVAFVSPHEEQAWDWASTQGRPRVHRVRPKDLAASSNVEGAEFITSSAKVVDTIWIPPNPGTRRVYEKTDDGYVGRDLHSVGVQGTLPHINWRQFGGENWTYLDSDSKPPEDSSASRPRRTPGQTQLLMEHGRT